MNAPTLTLPAPIGTEVGGGIYVGPHFQPDGSVHHLIAAHESMAPRNWEAANATLSGLRLYGFEDWFLPTKDQLVVGLLYAKEKFEKTTHWTSTPYGSDDAWSVDFRYGDVNILTRSSEFRVRPFRIHQFTPLPLSVPNAEPDDDAYSAYLQHSQPARAMLDIITSAGGDRVFECFELEQQQAYLHPIFNHVAAIDEVLSRLGGGKA